MLKKVLDGINDLEEKLEKCSDMNSTMFFHNKIYMIAGGNSYNEVSEYDNQPYSFKYGDYLLSDYLKQYI